MNKYKLLSDAARNARLIENKCLSKKAFHTEIEAKEFNKKNNLKQQVYFCTLCFRYHLSAKVAKFVNKIKAPKNKLKKTKKKNIKKVVVKKKITKTPKKERAVFSPYTIKMMNLINK